MLCKYCGNSNVRRAVYCAECGRKLKSGNEPTFYRVFLMLSLVSFALVLTVGAGLGWLLIKGLEIKEPAAEAQPSAAPDAAPASIANADDLAPVNAFVDFINGGGAGLIKTALPEIYAEKLLTASGLPEETNAELARRMMIKKITAKYGDFEMLDYELLSRRELGSEAGRELTLRLILLPSLKTQVVRLEVRLYGDEWKIAPESLI